MELIKKKHSIETVRRITNIRPKDDSNTTRVRAYSFLKGELNIGMADAKDFYYKILGKGELKWVTGRYDYKYYEFFPDKPTEWVEDIIKIIFDCEVVCEDIETITDYHVTVEDPDDFTLKAIAWYETLESEQKEMVDRLGEWKNPCAGPASGASAGYTGGNAIVGANR